MLTQGVIVPSRSPWWSPMIIVPRTDGSLQICIDFRRVNEIARFDAFSMPHVEELLERTGQARYISTIHLLKGYWQIPMAAKDQQKTTFSTPWGLFEFTRMPFGLHGAVAMFQRLMDCILAQDTMYAAT